MIPIYVASVCPYSGKNIVALGLAQHLRKSGMKVGFFKPYGMLPTRQEGVLTDQDAVLYKVALGLDEPLDRLCPLVLSSENFARALRGGLGNVRRTILDAYREVSGDKDAMILVGLGRLSAGNMVGYPSSQFIRDVEAFALIAEKYVWPAEALDGFIHMKNTIGEQLIGVVFNRVDQGIRTQIDNAVAPFLKTLNIDILGIIPEDPVLASVPLSELTEALSARVLCCESAGDVLIENFLVGAMNVNAAMTHFRRTRNKAVITGGDRSDIQMAALESDAECLILTGDLYPSERVLTRAEQQGVPVLLVGLHTGATLEICEHLSGHLSMRSPKKLARAGELIEQFIDFAKFYRKIGLQT